MRSAKTAAARSRRPMRAGKRVSSNVMTIADEEMQPTRGRHTGRTRQAAASSTRARRPTGAAGSTRTGVRKTKTGTAKAGARVGAKTKRATTRGGRSRAGGRASASPASRAPMSGRRMGRPARGSRAAMS